MSVTTILFKKGATVPAGPDFAATVGEPLWYTGGNQLYVTNGTNTPTLIGPIDVTQYTHPTFTIPTGSNYTVTTGTGGDQIIAAAANYAIGGFTVTSEGHVKAVSVVALPSHIKPDWNASAGSDSEILNKPTIPDAVSYVAVGTTSSGIHTIGTLTIGTTPYSLTCPAPTISGTNDGTNWTTITIGSETHNIPSGGGQTTGRDDELTAVTAGTGTVNLKTLQGTKYVTLRHDPVDQNNTGSMATFAVSNIEEGGADTGNRIVTMSITVIDGGSW